MMLNERNVLQDKMSTHVILIAKKKNILIVFVYELTNYRLFRDVLANKGVVFDTKTVTKKFLKRVI